MEDEKLKKIVEDNKYQVDNLVSAILKEYVPIANYKAKLTLLDEAEKQIAELKAKELSWIETSHKLKAEISRLKENLHLVGIVLKEKNKDLEISRLKIGLDVEKVKVKESK